MFMDVKKRTGLMTMNVMIMANENEVEAMIVRENTITARERNLGPTASSLLETNNFLEAEVVRLRNELSCTSIRIRALENELRLFQLQKQAEMQLSASTEQVSFLTKRNEVLGKKCEELVEKNRICREERDDAIKLVNSLKREIESMQAAVDLRLVDYKRMEYELSTVREKERMWKLEKVELERKLSERVLLFYLICNILKQTRKR
uniref:HOOK domain-containing protein n=1 Tax=Angiostrongylus cantonensis TaxID=6313 RepID=A0A158PB39_ANGCA